MLTPSGHMRRAPLALTAREAIMRSGGRVGFVQALCAGAIAECPVVPFPRLASPDAAQLRAVIADVRTLLGSPRVDAREWDRRAELPRDLLAALGRAGLFGLVIPKTHGGLGLGTVAWLRALQEVAYHDASVAVTLGAHGGIGLHGLLLFGTEEQKRRLLPRLAAGDAIAAFAVTERSASSDVASIQTTAVRRGGDWVIDGEKYLITNAAFAELFTVLARTPSPGGGRELTAFLVTRDMPGVTVGPQEDKLGIRASSTAAVRLADVRVPDANVLGEIGRGFRIAMTVLNHGRTAAGGGSVGAMKRLVALAARHANERVQFGRPLAAFGDVRRKIGEMLLECYGSEALATTVAGLVDRGVTSHAAEAAALKIFATECLWRTADEALQLAGGRGYLRSEPYEQVLRDSRIERIFEGTNEVLRLAIAAIAAKVAGARLQALGADLRDSVRHPLKGAAALSEYARARAELAAGIPRRLRLTPLETAVQHEADAFAHCAADTAGAVARLVRARGRLADDQHAARRLADALVELFALAGVLARVDARVRDVGPRGASQELAMVQAFCGRVTARVRTELAGLDESADELVATIGDEALRRGEYPWDVLEADASE
jgi:alkylation response protein AidB-like acyl-CoA dehydrogenase